MNTHIARSRLLGREGRLLLTLVALTLIAASFLSGAHPATASQVAVGYRDFSFAAGVPPGTGPKTSPAWSDPNLGPTGEKPQSKLWFNDGLWWGSLKDKASGQFHIWRFNWAKQAWTNTGTLIDDRSASHADCLWDGTHLYVATAGTDSSNNADSARILRYSYNSASKTYSLDSGFPVTVSTGGMEAVVLDKDSTGKLWITFTQYSQVLINNSTGNDLSWGTPYVLPDSGVNVTADDISAVIAFNGQIGVMWSNQVDDAMYFAAHRDSDPPSVWQPSQIALQGSKSADDHINLKSLQADPSGKVFAVTKTSFDELPTPSPNSPIIYVLVLNLSGNWQSHPFGTVANGFTRPILMIDQEHRRLYVFATAPVAGGIIYYKQCSLDNISFPAGLGTPFIESSTDSYINNATSTKQNLSSATGLLVEASDLVSGYYLHNTLSLGTPGATSTPTPTRPPATLTPTRTPAGTPPPTLTPTSTPSAMTPTNTPTATATGTATSYQSVVLSDNPVSYWRLGETGGTTAADSAGTNNGSIFGGVTLGVLGALAHDSNTAMSFNGSSGYVGVNSASNLNITGDISLEAWAKPAALNGIGGAVVHKGDASGYTVYQYRLSVTGGNVWRGSVFIGNSAYTVTDTGRPSVGRWDYLVMTRSGSMLTFYVNGVAVASTAATGALNTSSGILAIARTGSYAGDYFNGAIDEAAVYNTALSSARVLAHYNAGKGP